ncbi:hypothetical protein F5B18DRAFT_191418 [Nemania serpens]|nr:hypothetical protein F5B18DRAFT_191418 [Nemania serpens]
MRAIALNNKDYRAFFGLGQSYGFLEKPNMSLSFYHWALALRPGEMDIWRAMANCLVTLSKVLQAISAPRRALDCTKTASRKDEDGLGDSALATRSRLDTLFQLATLLGEEDNRHDATKYMEQYLDEASKYCDGENEEGTRNESISLIPKAQLLLVRWALEHGDQLRGRHFAGQMKEPSEHSEEASKLLDTISSSQVYKN